MSAALSLAFTKDQALKGRHTWSRPLLQGLARDGRFSQGVALGWLVVGPLALEASSFAKCMTGSRPARLLLADEQSIGKGNKSVTFHQ